MDEAIWVVIGILSVIIGVGVIATILSQGTQVNSERQVETALDQLANQCEQVCRLPQDTAASANVQLTRDMTLTTNQELICAQQGDSQSCRRCGCEFGAEQEILNLEQAPFNTHTYSCRFTKGPENNITMECQG